MPPRTGPSEKIRVFLVDDHPGMRRGIADCIAEQSDLAVDGEVGNAAEALAALAKTTPDVIVVDISLPGRDGLELIKDILARRRHARVLVFSMHDESLYAERALRAGARGYVMKSATMDELIGAIRRVHGGEFVLGRTVIGQLAARSAAGAATNAASPLACLTDREMEVFRLLGQGLERRSIAAQLRLSPKTIEAHRVNIRHKLGLDTSSALRRHAMEFLREESVGLRRG
jgi:DNA-binding NarL/FixJ family response regulator